MESCNCNSSPESNPVLAITTTVLQSWETIYDPASALDKGTVFPGLDKPFYVTGGGKHD